MNEEINLEEAIANCERDPIHIPGTIQACGALVALDSKFQHIEFASENTKKILGIEASELLGKGIDVLLDDDETHKARNCLSHITIEVQREIIGEKEFVGNRFQLSIHQKGGRSILEFLALDSPIQGEPSALEQTHALFAQFIASRNLQGSLVHSVDSLRACTGYDRVCAYRFLPDGVGEIVAESRASFMDSFLGLRFPASDIPIIARKLYSTTPIRVLADVFGADAAIIGLDNDAKSLDLSLAILRGKDSVHTQYLKNMGVKSSLTLPIVVDGVLWGLFAMHHNEPRSPDANILLAVELAGKMLGLVIQQATQMNHQSHFKNCELIGRELLEISENKQSMAVYWENEKNHLCQAIQSDGAAYIVGTRVKRGGSSPSDKTCLQIKAMVAELSNELSYFDNLQALIPVEDLGNTRGALVFRLSKTTETCLILFRDAASIKVQWAGAPEKQITRGKDGLQLNPRHSFSKYIESIDGKCEEWTNEDSEIAVVLQNTLKRDVETQYRLKLMVRELNHRVRNILSLVQSLSSNLVGSAESIEAHAVALEQRIVALAGAHNLLTREDLRGIPLKKLAELELQPYMENRGRASTLSGPEVVLNADVSPIIALVLHELTSNSVKFGALSKPEGSILLTWRLSDFGLEIEWLESGGPPVVKPERKGFGSSIIKDSIPYEFGGKADIRFEPSGVLATFSIPSRDFEAVHVPEMAVEFEKNQAIESPLAKLNFKRCLIVEDNFIVANQAKNWFEELGFNDVVAVATVNAALLRLNQEEFEFCLLDVNLRGNVSEPVAHKLKELGIPYLFATGYGSEGAALCNQFDVPFLTKPIKFEELREEILKLSKNE